MNNQTIIDKPSWFHIHVGSLKLVDQVNTSGYSPDIIVPLVRGGMIPAAIISHAMGDRPIFPINYSSQNGQGDDKETYLRELRSIPAHPSIIQEKLLFVDDICDSGKTLLEVMEYYSQFHICEVATLYYKDGAIITPSYIWQEIPEDAPFIDFPWEL